MIEAKHGDAEHPIEGHLDHPALLYESVSDFLEATVPFLAGGIEGGDVVFVAARGELIPPLRAALGTRASEARFADTDGWHPHPAARLHAFYELVADGLAGGADGFRLVGEPVWPAGPPEQVSEWQRYESVLNAVLAPFPVALLCLYDSTRLDGSVLTSAYHTHPTTLLCGEACPSDRFEPPEEFLRRENPDLTGVPSRAVQMPTIDLTVARGYLYEEAVRAGMSRDRAMDLCVAANEVLTNAQLHAGGATALWAWSDEARFVCQVEDRGDGIADPLAGYRPFTEGYNGRGLWLARQLVDLLQIVPGPSGTIVRLHALPS